MKTLRSLGVVAALALSGAALACSSGGDKSAIAVGSHDGATSTGTGSGGDDGSTGDDTGGGFDPDVAVLDSGSRPDYGAEAFWADDPPPATCGDSGVTPKVPGGTPECPDDKNRQGCPCTKVGDTAPCWPGLRKSRNHGICKDGVTTCTSSKEFINTWGPCDGYVLPTPGGTGKAACTCFSGGTWKLDNLDPCFIGDGTGITGAVSTSPNYDSTGAANPVCPAGGKPTENWTRTRLTVDCAGHFKLCYTLKAGDSKSPSPSDCVVTQQCASGDYTTAGVEQKWGDLPAWTSTDGACAKKFDSTGGYGEMSVVGESVECDHVEKVFQRVAYCSSKCSKTPSDPACAGCSSGGGGSF